MKKRFFALMSVILCFCFLLSGCNLFVRNPINIENQIAVQAGNVTLTREELLRGYSNYYSTFYRNNNGNSEKAFSDLIDYLLSKKIYISHAEDLIKSGDIELTDVEKNYIWYSAYTALITNIESFESKIKAELGIEEDSEEEANLDREDKFVYTPYDKIAEVVYNSESGQYEISVIKKVMVEKINAETGEKEYEYVSESKALEYPFSGVLFDIDYIKNLINTNKLFEGNPSLTDEEKISKDISKDAIRRYIDQLKNNEKGKDLSTDDESIFNREIDRIYKVIYENLLINKLYTYKASEISIDEEDVLNAYLEKVRSSYERYLLDEDQFTTELTTPAGSGYQNGTKNSKSIEDIFYVPRNEDEEFFYIAHIVVLLTPSQIQQINELKQECESNGYDDIYYKARFDEITDKTKIKLDERDKEGYIVVKSTDPDAITLAQMLANLEADLAEIDAKYDLGNLSEQEEYAYYHERADKFNEYIYKYSDDEGTLQIQTSMASNSENWYVYGLGTGDTDAGFVKNFVEAARLLNGRKNLTENETILMENWSTSSGVETLSSQSTGYSTIMYCGKVANLFECFDDNKFNLEDIFDEEDQESEARYYSLLKMDYQRLGLTMNKTLFDLIYEGIYNELYSDIIKEYEKSILKDVEIIKYQNVYSDIKI